MKNWIIFIGVICSLQSFGQNKPIIEESLLGCWVDSREENKPNSKEEIFRPCDYHTFPMSRYRFTMKLMMDGKCEWMFFSQNDAHHMVEGKWVIDSVTRILEIVDEHEKLVHTWFVSAKDEKLLILSKLNVDE